jgi:hypothetical protein
MRRIGRHIDINREQARLSLAALMPGDGRVGERLAQAVEGTGRRRLLEPGDGRLRREPRPVDRIAVQHQLVDRVVRQLIGIVAIGMPTRHREDARREQIADAVRHLARQARVADGVGQRTDHTEPPVGRFQQQRAAIGAGMGLVKGRDHGLVK